MTDPIDPIRSTSGDRRARVRRQADAQAQAPAQSESSAPGTNLPAPTVQAPDPQPIVTAQLLGQDGQKRGLRGGPQTLAQAKAAYLNAEWSGPTDRRGRLGLFSKTKI